ncbi:MAG: A/G-specific adenine glycosylase, partial [Oscillospiraceae bacterium]|nr:A/G-specific adenine glycosylase [Oscillospiraceae bacterium]
MLQQTRIEAVIPYYTRFLKELPDIQSLAAIPDDRLLKLWEGLGYYSRARNLKKAAVLLMEQYGGSFPASAAELSKLPGIGDYTAGAIASIAFGLPEPAVDGNVLRVITRLIVCSDDISDPKTKRFVKNLLRVHYPEGYEAGLLTEGIMELGETVCLPNGGPRCDVCPLKSLCAAHREG